MDHSKDLVFTFIMMLIFSCCTVLIDNYSTLYNRRMAENGFAPP